MVSCREKCHLQASAWNQIVVSSMNISLPETLSAFVRRRVAVRRLEIEVSIGLIGEIKATDEADFLQIRKEVQDALREK
jgi:hypothetical protein